MLTLLGYVLMLLGLWLLIYLAMVAVGKGNSSQPNLAFQDEFTPNQEIVKHVPAVDQSPSYGSPLPPPLPATGLPDGWTMEQWNYYGNQWLEQNERRT